MIQPLGRTLSARCDMGGPRLLLLGLILLASTSPRATGQIAQNAEPPVRTPRQFEELRGTWTLNEAAGKGHIAGLPIAHTLVISTTPFQISVTKNASEPEIYQFDGADIAVKDARTGATLDIRRRFALVAGMVALTSQRRRGDFTNIITDAYAADGDVLTVERQLSVLAKSGNLVTLSDEKNSRQTLVYRRTP